MEIQKYKITYENGTEQEKFLVPDNYFTESSPLGKALKSGVMELPEHQGGKMKVTFEKI